MSLRKLLVIAVIAGVLAVANCGLHTPYIEAETYLVRDFQTAVSVYRMQATHPQKAKAMLKALAAQGKAQQVGPERVDVHVVDFRTQTLTTDRGTDVVKVRITTPPDLAGEWWVNAEYVK